MDGILRFSGSVKRDPAIDAWLRERPIEFGSIAQRWFARMRQCGADVGELLHDGCPVACVADVPFAYVNVFRSHVNVGFFNRRAARGSHWLVGRNGQKHAAREAETRKRGRRGRAGHPHRGGVPGWQGARDEGIRG